MAKARLTNLRTCTAAALGCALLLGACGQRGPLYLPPPAATPAAKSQAPAKAKTTAPAHQPTAAPQTPP